MNDLEKNIVDKFISRHYPIKLIKINKKFKRGIVLLKNVNGFTVEEKLQLKIKNNAICEHIISDISIVFGFSREFLHPIITTYLNGD